jgi:hypothetical protein
MAKGRDFAAVATVLRLQVSGLPHIGQPIDL